MHYCFDVGAAKIRDKIQMTLPSCADLTQPGLMCLPEPGDVGLNGKG